MIDLRSDTLTRPTEAMRKAMMAADVGDDVYGEDPTVQALEERVANMAGKQAGLFCVTGSLSNLLGVGAHVEPGTEVICDAQAHIVRAELGAHAYLHGTTTRTWTSSRGKLSAGEVIDFVAHDAGPFLVRTSCIEVEDTHNFGGGIVQPLTELTAVTDWARDHDVATHLDGARIWHACVATETTLAERAAGFDTVSVCFSKGLGAPVGSMLLGEQDIIERARLERKRLGAGWRQAGMLAAAADYALDHHVERLTEDHEAAQVFATELATRHPSLVDPENVESNIVVLTLAEPRAVEIAAQLADQGLRLSVLGPSSLRAVWHLDVTVADARRAVDMVTPVV